MPYVDDISLIRRDRASGGMYIHRCNLYGNRRPSGGPDDAPVDGSAELLHQNLLCTIDQDAIRDTVAITGRQDVATGTLYMPIDCPPLLDGDIIEDVTPGVNFHNCWRVMGNDKRDQASRRRGNGGTIVPILSMARPMGL